MKITHVSPSPKAGLTEHLPPHRAQALIDTGFAVAVPMPVRGSREWLTAKQEQERERVALIPADQRQVFSPVPTWSVRYQHTTQKYFVVLQHLTTEVIYGEVVLLDRGRPDFKASEKQFIGVLKAAQCPQSVIKQWLDAKNAPDYLAAEQKRIDADKKAAAQQAERDKDAPRFI